MISDEFVIYFLAMLMMLVINLIGYLKVPILALLALIGTILLAPLAIIGFGDYYFFAFVLVFVNAIFGFFGVTRALKE